MCNCRCLKINILTYLIKTETNVYQLMEAYIFGGDHINLFSSHFHYIFKRISHDLKDWWSVRRHSKVMKFQNLSTAEMSRYFYVCWEGLWCPIEFSFLWSWMDVKLNVKFKEMCVCMQSETHWSKHIKWCYTTQKVLYTYVNRYEFDFLTQAILLLKYRILQMTNM